MKVIRNVIEAQGVEAEAALEIFNNAFESVEKQIIERYEALKLIKYAILTKQHVLLEGPHGLAKSMLAKAIFNCFSREFSVYKIQFNKGRNIEELNGPMDAKRYKEKAEWHYNTANMLPEAHFALIDEVYRATEHLLSACMSILNEREFYNGHIVMRCPLITAIGTTNFTPTSEELAAFHDRWLLRITVLPVVSIDNQVTMINQFLESEKVRPPKELIGMDELNVLQRAVAKMTLPRFVIELLLQLCKIYARETRAFVSDRRICQAAKLVCADAVLNGALSEKDVHEGYLDAARYALIASADAKHMKAYDDAFAMTVGRYARSKENCDEYTKLYSEGNALYDRFAPSDLSMRQEVADMLSRISSFIMASKGTQEQRDALAELNKVLTECHQTLSA